MSLLADIFRSRRATVEDAQEHANRILADTSITGAPRVLGVASSLPLEQAASSGSRGPSAQAVPSLESKQAEALAAEDADTPVPALPAVSHAEFWRGMHVSVWDKRRGGKKARVEKPWDRVSVRGEDPQRPQFHAPEFPRGELFAAMAPGIYARRNAAARRRDPTPST